MVGKTQTLSRSFGGLRDEVSIQSGIVGVFPAFLPSGICRVHLHHPAHNCIRTERQGCSSHFVLLRSEGMPKEEAEEEGRNEPLWRPKNQGCDALESDTL